MKQTPKRITIKMLYYLAVFIALWFAVGGRLSNWQPYALYVGIAMVVFLLLEMFWPPQKKTVIASLRHFPLALHSTTK